MDRQNETFRVGIPRVVRVLALALLAACGSATPSATPVANAQPKPPLVEPELDYRRPMLPGARMKETELYTSRCLRGDRDACLRAEMRTLQDDLLPQIEANCNAGHELSCRRVGARQGLGADYPFKLTREELRRGCAGGLWAECDLLMESKVPADVRFGAEITCLYAVRYCEVASSNYIIETPTNRERSRYLLELACQAEDVGSCSTLAFDYIEGLLEEPVPGRGRELARYACGKYPTDPCLWDLSTLE